MGKWGATAYIIGNIMGAGIFISPASILVYTNSVGLALSIWILSAIISILGAYTYVELGTSIRRSGADFAYLSFVNWKSIAFAFMTCGCILVYPATLAIQAATFSEYMIQTLNIKFENEWALFASQKLIGFSLIWLILYLNFFSIKTFVSRFEIISAVAKLASTGLVISIGMYYLIIKRKTEYLADPFANSTRDLGRIADAFFGGLFAYDGWDVLNFGVEELDNPRTTMSFAIIVGMLTVAVVFCLMNLSFFVVLSAQEITSSNAVASIFAQHTMGQFQYIIPILISLVLIGTFNGTMFAGSRYLFAASRQRQFPAFLSCVNSKHDSPRAALFIHVFLALCFSFAGNLSELVNYVGFCYWAQRVLTTIALLYIRLFKIPVHPDAIKTPIIVPILFLVSCTALCVVTIVQDFKSAFFGLLMLFGAFVIYYLFVWEKACSEFHGTIGWLVGLMNL
uniref:Amino acid transporter n=1 Tax=Ditylenchus dipsaci TaxID=166011 RepID=A0A915D349_9BILA